MVAALVLLGCNPSGAMDAMNVEDLHSAAMDLALPADQAESLDLTTCADLGPPHQLTLSYVDPIAISSGTEIKLVRDASSTPSTVVLNVVTTQAVAASSLRLQIAVLSGAVVLDAAQSGDTSPGFVVNRAALSDTSGSSASLPATCGTARVLSLYAGPTGSASDSSLPAGTEICRVRLTAPMGPSGTVFPLTADSAHPDPTDAYKPYLTTLHSSAGDSTKIALGTLTAH
jgi:hypothetical protein